MSPPKKTNPPPVPVLTEMVAEDMADIPTLTEVHIEPLAPMSDEQCQQLVRQITPQMEALLRARLSQNIDVLLQEILLEVRTSLPDLIRAALKHKHPL